MPRQARYRLSFAPETMAHLDAIEPKYHRLIAKAINEQLALAPESQTRNRKPLEAPAPSEATWELRLGPGNRFRVFYEVDVAERTVWILAIGVKIGNRLFIGGEEFEL
jgi:mRNA-degrading endonuclease RelE of RelBE toxin-antitoxin system